MVPLNTSGDRERPNIRRMNWSTTISSISRSLIQWNLKASRSSLLIMIFRKTCFKTPIIATGFKRHRVSTFQSVFCSTGPTSKHSFKDGLAFVGLVDISCTIQSLVVSADCFITGLWGMQNSFDVVVPGASLTIPSTSCSFILSSYSLKSAGYVVASKVGWINGQDIPFLLLCKVVLFGFHGNPAWYQLCVLWWSCSLNSV